MAIGRIRQGIRALMAWSRPVDYEAAQQVLTPKEMELFRQMRRSEQQHSLNVLKMLQGWGYDDPPLLIAALLHDVGKSRYPFPLWDRTIVVLVKAVAPKITQKWGNGSVASWRRPFVISYQHPAWSAQLATDVGCDPRAVELIAIHQIKRDHELPGDTERLLTALQKADDNN